MSRYLVMALVASCGLAQGAMAETRLYLNKNLFPMINTPQVGTIKVTTDMTCGPTSLTLTIPKAETENGEPKWYNLIWLGTMGEWYVLSRDETSFTRSDLNPKYGRTFIYLYKAYLRPDGKYDFNQGRKGSSFFYFNTMAKACVTTR